MRITAGAAALFGRAVSLKLAADGEWERALTLSLDARDADRRTRDQWLETAGDDVAIEIAFETHAFVGLRLRSDERASANQLVSALLLRLAHADNLGGLGRGEPHEIGLSQVIDAIDKTVRPRFAGMTASRAELGVLDRWVSLGAADLGPPPFQSLAESFPRRHPGWAHLTSALPAPLLLEVTYGETGDGWLAAPVSDERRGIGGTAQHYARPDTFDRVAATLAALS